MSMAKKKVAKTDRKLQYVLIIIVISFTAFASLTFVHLINESKTRKAAINSSEEDAPALIWEETNLPETVRVEMPNTIIVKILDTVSVMVPETIRTEVPVIMRDTLFAFAYQASITYKQLEPVVRKSIIDSFLIKTTDFLDSPILSRYLRMPKGRSVLVSYISSSSGAYDTGYLTKEDFDALSIILDKYFK